MFRLKKIDYDALGKKMAEIESSSINIECDGSLLSVIPNTGFIITDNVISYKELDKYLLKYSKEIDITTNYVSAKKNYIKIADTPISRVYETRSYINATDTSLFTDNSDKTTDNFRIIIEHIEATTYPFTWCVLNISEYLSHKKEFNINYIQYAAILIDSEHFNEYETIPTINDHRYYSDIVASGINYDTLNNFEFAMYYAAMRIPTKESKMKGRNLHGLGNDIYFDKHPKKTYARCILCSLEFYGKYYVYKENPYCKFCAHTKNQMIIDMEPIFVLDSGKKITDIISIKNGILLDIYDSKNYKEIKNNFYTKDKIYQNDKYLLYRGPAYNYLIGRDLINPKKMKVVLIF